MLPGYLFFICKFSIYKSYLSFYSLLCKEEFDTYKKIKAIKTIQKGHIFSGDDLLRKTVRQTCLLKVKTSAHQGYPIHIINPRTNWKISRVTRKITSLVQKEFLQYIRWYSEEKCNVWFKKECNYRILRYFWYNE